MKKFKPVDISNLSEKQRNVLALTFPELLDIYCQAKPGKRPDIRKFRLRKWRAQFKDISAWELQPEHVAVMVEAMESYDYAAPTINRDVADIASCYAWASCYCYLQLLGTYTHAGSNSEEVHQQSTGKVNNDYTETIVKSEIPVSMRSSPEENIKIRSDLIALESRDRGTLEDSGIDEILPPEKQYTAFTNVETESGDFITTGRVFIAGEWSKPTSQYCYLAIPGMVGGTGLANVDGEGNLSISTEDPLLISFMRNYCRFE